MSTAMHWTHFHGETKDALGARTRRAAATVLKALMVGASMAGAVMAIIAIRVFSYLPALH